MSVLIVSLPFVLAEEYRIDYDANGNIIYDQETNVYREYNELNQLVRTRINNVSGTILQEYTYDPLKERIFIKNEFYANGSLKSSTYYFDDDYIVIQNSSGTYNRTNIYQDGILVGYEDFDGKKRYVLPDHEGSAHIVLDENGNVLEENLFSPFAEPLQGVKENKFSYEAKEYDSLVQDYDFNFRKYCVGLRIFCQPDSLLPNPYDPQKLNRYAFERNNPYKNTDPTGHFEPVTITLTVAFTAVAVIGAVVLGSALIGAAGGLPRIDVEGIKSDISKIAQIKEKIDSAIDLYKLEQKRRQIETETDPERKAQLEKEYRELGSEFLIKRIEGSAAQAAFGKSGSSFLKMGKEASYGDKYSLAGMIKYTTKDMKDQGQEEGYIGGSGCRNCFVTTRSKLEEMKRVERNRRAISLFAKIRSRG